MPAQIATSPIWALNERFPIARGVDPGDTPANFEGSTFALRLLQADRPLTEAGRLAVGRDALMASERALLSP